MFDYTVLKYDGGYNDKVEELESEYRTFSSKYNSAVSSATAAADIIFSYLYQTYGPLKITCPTLSFCSPAMMALRNNHYVKFVDINPYLNQAEYNDVNMPVLYGGSSLSIKNSTIVDSAHNPKYKHVPGDYIFTSFFPTKPIKSFTGGMISSVKRINYFNIYRNFGRLDEVIYAGNKYYMDGFNASIILENMKKYEEEVKLRKRNLSLYEDLREYGLLVEHDDFSSYYLGSLVLKEPVAEQLRAKTADLFNSRLHYPLLHKQLYFENHPNCIINKCEYAEYIEHRLFTLPIAEHYQEYQIKFFKEEIIKCLRSL